MTWLRIGKALRRLRRDERGVALPVAMLTAAIGMTFAAVVVVASVSTQRGDSRDQASNSALAAADAAANLAVLRQGGLTTCASGQPETVGAEMWCPSVNGKVGDTEYTYRVQPPGYGSEAGVMTIISTGTTQTPEVSRRLKVKVAATSSGGGSMFLGEEGLVGGEWVQLGGGGNTTYGPVGSNGTITWTGGSNRICGGSLRYGPTAPYPITKVDWRPPAERPYVDGNDNGLCGPFPTAYQIYPEEKIYPAVKLPSDISTNNSNGRFFSQDGRDLPSWYLQNPTNSWNPTTRTLSIDSGVTLSLAGTKPYFLCRLRLEGGATIKAEAPGQPVQIYFDAPENCSNLPSKTLSKTGASAYEQLIVANGTSIIHNGYFPGFFFVGSSAKRTLITLETQNFNGVIYGPRTDLQSINGGLRYTGGINVRSATINGGGRVTSTFKGSEYKIPADGGASTVTYAKKAFIECAASPPSNDLSPAAGC